MYQELKTHLETLDFVKTIGNINASLGSNGTYLTVEVFCTNIENAYMKIKKEIEDTTEYKAWPLIFQYKEYSKE